MKSSMVKSNIIPRNIQIGGLDMNPAYILPVFGLCFANIIFGTKEMQRSFMG